VNAASSGGNAIIQTAGPGGPAPLQDVWRDRAVIPAQRMHAKGVGAYGTFAVTVEVGRCVRVDTTLTIGEQTLMFACFPTVSGGWGAADVVGQQRASHRPGVEGHPSRQVGNCAKSGPTL